MKAMAPLVSGPTLRRPWAFIGPAAAAPHPLLAPRQAGLLICALAAATLIADILVPEDLDISVYYILGIAASAWLRSPRLLWLGTFAFAFMVFGELPIGAPPLHADDPWWLHVANRLFVVSAFIVMASIVHLWIRSLDMLEESRRLLARQNEQLRIGGAELEQRVQERTRELETASRLHREAEAALFQAQKMEAVGQLTGGVAHDFNNLLTVIGGTATMLRQRAHGEREARQLDAILQATQRGERLTRQLLAFSRRQALRPEAVDLRKRAQELSDLLARSLRQDIRIIVAMDEALWPIHVDPAALELTLLNIGVNARDAMPSGGILRIEARNATYAKGADPQGELEGDYVAITLTDNGGGMTPEVQDRAFEPFFTTKERGKGSGLGLSQVYGFAHQSGGTVSLRSRPGEGTAVTLYLPRATASAALHLAAPRPSPPLAPSGGEILYVEDNPEVAEVTTAMLDELGYHVHWVSDARSALAVLADEPSVDLVLSDIVAPGGMSGVDLAHILRQRFPRLPILLTTGYSEAAAEVRREGFGILPKPYNATSLAAALARHTASA